MTTETVFAKIVKGEIPCYKVFENENCLAFLDISPLEKGHTIIIPKKSVDYVFDLDDSLYNELFLFSKKVAKGIQLYTNCKKVGIAVVGLEVPHAHIHLIPLNFGNEINFQREKMVFSSDEFLDIARQIKQLI